MAHFLPLCAKSGKKVSAESMANQKCASNQTHVKTQNHQTRQQTDHIPPHALGEVTNRTLCFEEKKKNHTVANRSFVDNQVWQNVAANNQTTVKLVSFVARTHEDVREKESGKALQAILACLEAEFCTYNIKISKARTMYLNYLRFLPAG